MNDYQTFLLAIVIVIISLIAVDMYKASIEFDGELLKARIAKEHRAIRDGIAVYKYNEDGSRTFIVIPEKVKEFNHNKIKGVLDVRNNN